MRTWHSLIIFLFFFNLIAQTSFAQENIFQGRIFTNSFKPIKKYESDFQKATKENPKIFVNFLNKLFKNFTMKEKLRFFLLIEEDLVTNKVDPKDIYKIIDLALGPKTKKKKE